MILLMEHDRIFLPFYSKGKQTYSISLPNVIFSTGGD